jgi:5-methylcytosine-specific restriction endonuclease McrBC regulatory subunit McrC
MYPGYDEDLMYATEDEHIAKVMKQREAEEDAAHRAYIENSRDRAVRDAIERVASQTFPDRQAAAEALYDALDNVWPSYPFIRDRDELYNILEDYNDIASAQWGPLTPDDFADF